MSATRGKSLPWWLQDDSESCQACSHAYAHRTEIYCVDCDGPVCPVCVQQTITLELICPGCADSRAVETEVS
jgi:hypothetical protein